VFLCFAACVCALCFVFLAWRTNGENTGRGRTETAAAHGDARTLQVYEEAVGEKAFMRIVVLPHFL
jgi:hypothetical protein